MFSGMPSLKNFLPAASAEPINKKISSSIGLIVTGKDTITFHVYIYGVTDSRSREPRFESPLLLFQSLGIFVVSTMPQFTQLCNETSVLM